MSRPTVYVACPYTIGDQAARVSKAMARWDALWELGFAPYCPLWSHFQHLHIQRSYDEWMEFSRIWLLKCDAVLRLPGESRGADMEVLWALSAGIPVLTNERDLVNCFSDRLVRNGA